MILRFFFVVFVGIVWFTFISICYCSVDFRKNKENLHNNRKWFYRKSKRSIQKWRKFFFLLFSTLSSFCYLNRLSDWTFCILNVTLGAIIQIISVLKLFESKLKKWIEMLSFDSLSPRLQYRSINKPLKRVWFIAIIWPSFLFHHSISYKIKIDLFDVEFIFS